jgi:signal recognition particle GTPase
MTAAQLNAELKKRKIEAPPKALKKALQDLLLTLLSSTKAEKGKKKKEDKKAKEAKEEGKEKKTKTKKLKKLLETVEEEKKYSKEEVDKMTVAALNKILKQKDVVPPLKATKKVLQELVHKTLQEEQDAKERQGLGLAFNTRSKRKPERFVI